MVHHGQHGGMLGMLTREVLEAMIKSEVLQFSSLLELRLTCKAFHNTITGHFPAGIECNLTPNPNRLS